MFLIVLRGHFTCYACPTPGGTSLPRGTIATLIWNARRGVTDSGLSDSLPAKLSKLGQPLWLSLVRR